MSKDAGTSFASQWYVESASFGTALDGTPFRLYTPWAVSAHVQSSDDPYALGCGALPALPPQPGLKNAYALSRGSCGFGVKAKNAVAAGASALVVYDSIAGFYINSANSTALNASALVANRCYYDCGAGSGVVSFSEAANLTAALAGFPGRCSSSGSGCESNLCLLTGETYNSNIESVINEGGNQPITGAAVCCAVNSYLPMSVSDEDAPLLSGMQAVFVPVGQGAVLQAALTSAAAAAAAVAADNRKLVSIDATGGRDGAVDPIVVSLQYRPTPAFDASGALMILLGFAVAAGASFYAAWPEREAIKAIIAGQPPPVRDEREGPVGA